jgi:hypothetical protein
VDVEAEILSLHLRMQALEESARFNSEDAVIPDSVPLSGTAVSGIQRELADDLEGLGVEIAGLRWQANLHYTIGHSQLLERLDYLRIGMHRLELRLDQLLTKDNA